MTINRELSQFASFVSVDDATKKIGIGSTGSTFVGIGTANPTSSLHVEGNVFVNGIGTITTLNATSGIITSISGVAATITTLRSTTGIITNISGVAGTITTLNATSGIITSISGVAGTITTLNSTTGNITSISGTNLYYTGISTIGDLNVTGTAVTFNNGLYVSSGIAVVSALTVFPGPTNISGNVTFYNNINASGISTLGVTNTTNLTSQQLNVSGLSTFSGITTHTTSLFGTQASFSGIVTASTFSGNLLNTLTLNTTGIGLTGLATFNNAGASTFTVTSNATSANTVSTIVSRDPSGNFSAGTITATLSGNASSATYATSSGVSTSVSGGIASVTSLNASGISTFTNGPVLIGTGTSTGTASQPLQVTGGAYVSGNLGIGSTNPSSQLTVSGDVLVSGIITSRDYNSSSDLNLKENVLPISDPVDKVLKLTGVTFNWKETGQSSMGVIAQEVEQVLPELVNGTDSKTVNYNGLIGLLIEVVKDQQIQINNLKEKLK